MAKSNKSTKSRRRAKIKELPAQQELTTDQTKAITGGLEDACRKKSSNALMGDGSVRNIKDGTSNTLLVAESK